MYNTFLEPSSSMLKITAVLSSAWRNHIFGDLLLLTMASNPKSYIFAPSDRDRGFKPRWGQTHVGSNQRL